MHSKFWINLRDRQLSDHFRIEQSIETLANELGLPTQAINQDQREPRHQQITRIIYRPVDFRHIVDSDGHRDAAPLRIDYADSAAQMIERAILCGHWHVRQSSADGVMRLFALH